MTNDALIATLYEIGAIQFGEFTLKSGQTSKIYINLRKIVSYPTLMRQIAKAIWKVVAHSSFDLICGVPYTALPIATCISLDQNIPMIMRRKEKKDYGTKQMIEGVYEPGQFCLIIEDVVTSGASIIETAVEIETVGLKVNEVVCLIDREQGGRETLQAKYQFNSVFCLSDILGCLLNSSILEKTEHSIVEELLIERSA